MRDAGKDASFEAAGDEARQIDYRNIGLEKSDGDYEDENDDNDDDDVNKRLLSAGGPSSPSTSTLGSDNDDSREKKNKRISKAAKKASKSNGKGEVNRETVRWRDLPEKGQLTVLTLARLSEPLVQTSLQVGFLLSVRRVCLILPRSNTYSPTCSTSSGRSAQTCRVLSLPASQASCTPASRPPSSSRP